MTGIERLHKLIADIDVSADPELWYILREGTEGDWDCEEHDDKTLGSTLAAIAEQIERNQGGRVSRMRVLSVVTEMERHVSGVEGAEDSPVARWARELREALGGNGRDHAADGEPLEVGQTVWDENGDELVIGAIEDGGHTVACRYADVGDGIPVHGMWSPSDLTHQRPVPDADGRPLREGETVWDTDAEADTPLTVVEVSSDLVRCEYTWKDGKTYRPCYPPDQLTHKRPDTWQRIEEDAGCTANKYNERRGTIFTTKQQVARDLVRRCRALAERERGE